MNPQILQKAIREIPNFPLPGILFRDIFPILADPELFQIALDHLFESLNLTEVDAFVGIESRGFILAAAMAARSKKGFIPLRKAGKLPPPTMRHKYELEYGSAELEIAEGSGRVVIVDDVLATGGTLTAATNLCLRAGYEVTDIAVLIDLKSLNAFRFRDLPVKAVLNYE